MKRDIILAKLEGLESRQKMRESARRKVRLDSLERQSRGIQREYQHWLASDRRKRA